VSPRRNRPARPATDDEPALTGGIETVEFTADGEEWVVRRVTGASSAAGGKSYRCPGCDQQIPPSTAHVVAWVRNSVDGRRHWHTPCWAARSQRAAKVRRPGR
jgi:hypothetical protein